MSHTYQLTKYPVGTKREFFALSWPLMLGFISHSLMLFVDRLFLANYDPLALNAAVTGGITYWMFFIIMMGIVSISEVLAGRLHGEGKWKEIGSSTWQMIFFAIASLPLYWILAWIMPYILFNGTGNEVNETTFFRIMMMFAPLSGAYFALTGFFMGIGDVKKVTYSALLGNAVNIVLDYWFIFGAGPIPSMGITGAVLATGLAQVAQVVFLLSFFLKKTNRETYHTHRFSFNKAYLIEGLKIGTPSGLGYFLECTAHFLFFRIVMSVGHEQMTVVSIVQTFSMLFYFITNSFNKSASAIVSNLIGAKMYPLTKQVLRSAFTLHACCFIAILLGVFLFADYGLTLFGSGEHAEVINDPHLHYLFMISMVFFTIHFLFDGWAWILAGFLTSAGDTKFILKVSAFVHWVAYFIPTLLFIGYMKGEADVAWAIVAAMSGLNFGLYAWRYFSGAWLSSSKTSKDTVLATA